MRELSMSTQAVRARQRRAEIRARVLAEQNLVDSMKPERKAERRAARLAAQHGPIGIGAKAHMEADTNNEALQQLLVLTRALQLTVIDLKRRMGDVEQLSAKVEDIDRRFFDVDQMARRAIDQGQERVDLSTAIGRAFASYANARE